MPIVPLTPEAEWLTYFQRLRSGASQAKRVLLVAPHPDDEVLGAGGVVCDAVAAGAEVMVVAVTDGEAAYGGADAALAALRSREQTAALHCLGVPSECILRLHLPDSAVAAHEPELAQRFAELAPDETTHILAPWTGDFHPDHEACGRASIAAARQTGARLSFWFFWTWHRGRPADLPERAVRVAISAAALSAKQRAIACHESQVRHEPAPILTPELLLPAERRFEVLLPA